MVWGRGQDRPGTIRFLVEIHGATRLRLRSALPAQQIQITPIGLKLLRLKFLLEPGSTQLLAQVSAHWRCLVGQWMFECFCTRACWHQDGPLSINTEILGVGQYALINFFRGPNGGPPCFWLLTAFVAVKMRVSITGTHRAFGEKNSSAT